MNQFSTLLKYEWLNFKADKGLLILTSLALLAGLYGIYYGTSEIERQQENIAQLEIIAQENIEEMKDKYPGDADAGDLGYYHYTFAINEPDSWAGLSLGQRDLNPYYLKLRLLNLQSQIYDTDNINPLKILSGNFDLAFVFVYLFPLLIIGLCFNILSIEKEQGTLPLLLSQPIGLPIIVGAKLVFRIIIVFTLALFLSIVAMWWAQVVPDIRIVIWIAAICMNCLFWFGVTFLVAALQKNSAFNSVVLLGIWLGLTIIIPSLLNIYVAVKQPVPQALDLTIKQREEVHGGWDKPKKETMERFFIHHPEWQHTAPIEGRFDWRWYYAFQHLGDVAVEDLAIDYQESLRKRHKLANQLDFLSIPVNVQTTLNAIAASDLPSHLNFIRSATQHHDAIRAFYYPFLFNQIPFTHAEYQDEPEHSFMSTPDFTTANKGLVKLFISTLLVFIAGFLIFKLKGASVK
ncbi:ABC transporter permease [Autumnicola musiva]|uniref:DUF3526 domain-containing protein n=1 Tax=Autumnicola musiva TaxID=3075589 RepID=A0ABU3DAH8_9FLAO|nr:DUF3526 domain-containing protein [Zunongwangia sp. F117]MDT0678539.1 DUF3526 domain-containing protein [Zunongwangia sp. F117]